MNTNRHILSTVLFIFPMLLFFYGKASAEQLECEIRYSSVKAVKSNEVRETLVNFNTNESGEKDSTGFLDPDPLISTNVTVNGRTSRCLVARFSAMAEPRDSHIMFQVLIDGVPMEGHGIFPFSVPLVENPVVWDPEETDQDQTRMVSYSFFADVDPGEHTIEVLFAGCCGDTSGGDPIAVVRSSVLTIEY